MKITKGMVERYAEHLHRHSHIRIKGEKDDDPEVWNQLRKRAHRLLLEARRAFDIANGKVKP